MSFITFCDRLARFLLYVVLLEQSQNIHSNFTSDIKNKYSSTKKLLILRTSTLQQKMITYE